MPVHYPPVAHALGSSRKDIVLLFYRENHGANHACEVVYVCQEYRHDHILHAQAEYTYEHDGDDEVGEGPLYVNVALSQHVDPAAVIAAQHTKGKSYNCGKSETEHSDNHGGAGPNNKSAK